MSWSTTFFACTLHFQRKLSWLIEMCWAKQAAVKVGAEAAAPTAGNCVAKGQNCRRHKINNFNGSRSPKRPVHCYSWQFMYMCVCLLVNANMLSTEPKKWAGVSLLLHSHSHSLPSICAISVSFCVWQAPKLELQFVGEPQASFGTAVKLDLIFKRAYKISKLKPSRGSSKLEYPNPTKWAWKFCTKIIFAGFNIRIETATSAYQ